MSDTYDQAELLRETRKAVFEAIASVREKVGKLVRDQKNDYAKYKFAGIDQYYDIVAPLAFEAGIHWICSIMELDRVKLDEDEKDVYSVVVNVDMLYKNGVMLHEYQVMRFEHPIMGPQSGGSILSYADRFFMRSAFKIPTGEGDPEAFDNRQQPKQAQRAAKPAAKAAANQSTERVSAPVDEEAPDKVDNKMEVDLKIWLEKIKAETELDRFIRTNAERLLVLKSRDPDQHERIRVMFEAHRSALAKAGETASNGAGKAAPAKKAWTSGTRPAKTVRAVNGAAHA